MTQTVSQLIIALDYGNLLHGTIGRLEQSLRQIPDVSIKVILPFEGVWRPCDLSEIARDARLETALALPEALRAVRTAGIEDALLSIWLLKPLHVAAITGAVWQELELLLENLAAVQRITLHFAFDPGMAGTRTFIQALQTRLAPRAALKTRLKFQEVSKTGERVQNIAAWLTEFMLLRAAPEPDPAAPPPLIHMTVAPPLPEIMMPAAPPEPVPMMPADSPAEPAPLMQAAPPEPDADMPLPDDSPEPTPPPDHTVRSVWEIHEPDDPYMPVPHELMAAIAAPNHWNMVGASIRGRSHAHDGKYREDAFALDIAGSWNLIAVSDGAGSRQYSRIGSKLATEAASQAMKQYLLEHDLNSDRSQVETHLHAALHAGLQHAYQRLESYVENEHEVAITFQDLGCTLLLAIYGEAGGSYFVAGLQVGDGLIMLANNPADLNDLIELTHGDIADFSGGTTFLTSETLAHWQQREASIYPLDQPPWLLLVMTDGVADDMVPYDRNVPRFLLPAIQRTGVLAMADHLDDAAKQLCAMINYEKKGSFDDRTLVVMYQPAG